MPDHVSSPEVRDTNAFVFDDGSSVHDCL